MVQRPPCVVRGARRECSSVGEELEDMLIFGCWGAVVAIVRWVRMGLVTVVRVCGRMVRREEVRVRVGRMIRREVVRMLILIVLGLIDGSTVEG